MRTKPQSIDLATDEDLTLQAPPESTAESVDDLIRSYKTFAKRTVESTLQHAWTVLKADALDSRGERERFYKEVKLDPDGSTARKLRVIGGAQARFQPFLSVLPNTWTTLYELAKMSDDEFKKLVGLGILHPFATQREIDEARGVASTKTSVEFPLQVDLYKISTTRRQAEFLQKLEVLFREFGIDMEPMGPKRKQELLRIRAVTDDQQQAA